MFTGISAFPLTPVVSNTLDEPTYIQLIERLVTAGVDSIGALGSTGSYAYLTRVERARIAQLAVKYAGTIPVIVGIGGVGTREVLTFAEDAQKAGASGVLLAPVSYQKLTHDEVYGLYETVTRNLSIPLCIYDNPQTTNFEFSDELYARIAQLPNVGSIKIPAVPLTNDAAKARVEELRALLPSHVTIGISGDGAGARGLVAGCEAWYSVLGGLFPKTAVAITRAVQAGQWQEAEHLSGRLQPLWELFGKYGSLRVTAAAAEIQGLVERPSLLAPVRALEGGDRQYLATLLGKLELE